MAKLKTNRINQNVLLLAVCLASTMFGFILGKNKPAIASAIPKTLQQSDEKVIERKEFSNEPFRFNSLNVQNTAISLNQKFSAKTLVEKNGGKLEDWLENLKFTLINTSDKQITYIDVELDFPETKVNGPMMGYNQIGIGIPPQASEDILKHTKPLALESDDTVTFTLSAQNLRMIKEFLALRKFSLADINQVVIRIDHLIFDDGTKWQIGRLYKPVPNAPGSYEQISPNIQ